MDRAVNVVSAFEILFRLLVVLQVRAHQFVMQYKWSTQKTYLPVILYRLSRLCLGIHVYLQIFIYIYNSN